MCWSACAHDPPCPCRSTRAGRPAPFARPAFKQAPVPWSYTRSRRGRSCGLKGAGFHDRLVLNGEPLTPRRYQDRQGARQIAVLLPDPKVAQSARVARIRHIVNSRNRALYLLRAVSALLSASCRFLSSLFSLLAYSLSYSLRSLSSISASESRVKNLLYLCSLLLERFVEPSLDGAAEVRRAAVAPVTERSGGVGVRHFTESAAECGSALSPRFQVVGAPHGGAQRRWE